ncbi:uncharacterized protein LOC107271934 [Cephus cinctus]|uniref:Uncharacterized protein LOC107271934 n=1 Tax=Cephus cinctus TaxID=211228 RepID=A0AAJ7C7Q8_CEPCN|nr:uncharacterized protein LOC107271934 [Cephus cinctus]XP_015604032.1 uncharacterized protein LOC107271934 [Cephus cinctus]
MWLPTVGLMLLCLYASPCNSREITHDDIKDAMLSLVHMMRDNTEKLERHEARERALGEQMKKTISLLTKRVSTVDGLKTHLTKMDERISGIERLITQRDERERIQMQKTTDALEDLESRLEGWLTNIENKVAEVNNRPEVTPSTAPEKVSLDVMRKLNDTEARLAGQIATLEIGIETMGTRTKDEAALQADKIQTVFTQVRDIGARLGDMESGLDFVKENLGKIQENPKEPTVDVNPAMEMQTLMLSRVKELLEDTSERIRELPKVSEVQTLYNESQMSLQETKHTLENVIQRGIDGVGNKVSESKEEVKDTVSALRLDLANNAERVKKDLQDLEKGQSVMVSMADHVLDTRKRVEYGVHQILLEVGDLVKAQGTSLNTTLTERFDGISNDIINNQKGALANLTTKMEQEMNQVWRQINVMYQQMMESAKALEKLHKQNEAYVNGTTTTMGSMESKVSEITKRMREVDENLNYLLGRLSLVTQEFNQIKSGLGTALDNIKASFKEVQDKAKDLSTPGPHPVPEHHKEVDEARSLETSSGERVPEISNILSTIAN